MFRLLTGISLTTMLVLSCGTCIGQNLSLGIQKSERDEGLNGFGGGGEKAIVSGWEFKVESACKVRALGFFELKIGASQVGIWTKNGELLASVNFDDRIVPKKLIEGFRLIEIEPIELQQGESYVVGALYLRRGGIERYTPQDVYSSGAIRWTANRLVTAEKDLIFPEKTGGGNRPDFGPSFILEHEPMPRIHYSEQNMAPRLFQGDANHEFDFQLIVQPERLDKAHLLDHAIFISFFGSKDGIIRQVCLNGKPLGDKETAASALADQLPKQINELVKRTGVEPKLRLASPSWLDPVQVTGMVNSALGRENNEAEIGKLEFPPIYLRAMNHAQPSPESRFVVSGNLAQDSWTKLVWQLDGAVVKKVNFFQAAELAGTVQIGEFRRWRVPNRDELATIFPAIEKPFMNSGYKPDLGGSCSYWTSDLEGPNYAFVYQWYGDGGPNNCYADKNFARVRFVHDSAEIATENKTRK